MAKKKIGWKMKLKRELRQKRAEEKIRAKDLAKRQKLQNKILGDTDIDAVKDMSAKIGQAEQQLSDDGYDPSGDPVETMVQYNDVYGGGNGELDEAAYSSFDESNSLENAEGEDGYSQILYGLGNVISNFTDNFDRNNGEDWESYEENFGEKLKQKFGAFLGGGKKMLGGSGKDSSNQSISEIAEDISIMYPKKSERLLQLAKTTGKPKIDVTGILLGAIAGVILSKMFK